MPPPAQAPRFSPAATAAAGATWLVVASAAAHPWVPSGSRVDAVVNEWSIWFTALYLALHTGGALLERLSIRSLHQRPRP